MIMDMQVRHIRVSSSGFSFIPDINLSGHVFSKACIFIVERNCCFKIVREFHDSGSTLKIFEVHVTLC